MYQYFNKNLFKIFADYIYSTSRHIDLISNLLKENIYYIMYKKNTHFCHNWLNIPKTDRLCPTIKYTGNLLPAKIVCIIHQNGNPCWKLNSRASGFCFRIMSYQTTRICTTYLNNWLAFACRIPHLKNKNNKYYTSNRYELKLLNRIMLNVIMPTYYCLPFNQTV